MSPVQRSLNLLREEGYICRSVEHFNPYAHIRQDLWGMDILAFTMDEPGVLGVQCTTAANLSARVKKLREMPENRMWCGRGPLYTADTPLRSQLHIGITYTRRCEVWGWGKTGKRGERKRWTVRRVAL